ncbi:MAG TPA: tetratricopeptide repeat-containing sensor histidine kinase, partial [Cyclobacteriaceae bacterium]|nr:tetratricopeptide repeat-containing sensor histidine kinase [Cyclobacteriaceae bacterium]
MSFKEIAYHSLVGIFCFMVLSVSAQNQKVADSLTVVYNKGTLKDTAKLKLLQNLTFNENNTKLALKYADELITLSQKSNNNKYLYSGYYLKGNKQKRLGNLDEAMAAYFKSAESAKLAHSILGEGVAYSAIASIYNNSNNYENAIHYYRKAIVSFRYVNNPITLASVILNAGEAFRTHKDYDSALIYFKEADTIFVKINYLTGKAFCLGNMGMIYASTGKNNLAENYISKAIRILQDMKNYYPICSYLISMSDIYLEKGNEASALGYALRSLQLAKEQKLKKEISEADLKLSQLYEKAGNLKESFSHYKDYITYRDSVNNIAAVQKMADLRTNYEVAQKQVEVDLLNQQKKNQLIVQIGSVAFFSIIIIGLGFSRWQKQQSNKKLQAQQVIIAERNDQLQEVNASKDKLFSIIGHDLKGPLNALNMFSKLLSTHTDSFSKEEIKKLAVDLNMSVKNLYKLLENLLEWGRSQVGAIDFTPEKFDMAAVLKANQELLKSQAENKNITVVNEAAEALPVNAHHNTIDTVVRNILSNAIKFTPEGGKVELRAEQTDGYARVSIADNGVGINQSSIAGLFKVGTHHNSLGTAQEKG